MISFQFADVLWILIESLAAELHGPVGSFLVFAASESGFVIGGVAGRRDLVQVGPAPHSQQQVVQYLLWLVGINRNPTLQLGLNHRTVCLTAPAFHDFGGGLQCAPLI